MVNSLGPVERKRVELRRKMDALDQELARWLTASSSGSAFRTHHTQIRAVSERLKSFRERIRTTLLDDPGLSSAHEMSRMILALHRIWEFFRVKFAQRHELAFAPYLRIADEFAWLCYQPVYRQSQIADPSRRFREPPLVFLNGGSSPFILTRDSNFQAEAVPGEFMPGASMREATSRLPFPVIGVPWHQIVQLPEALVISHEVGHSIEADLDLETTLDTLLDESLQASGGTVRARYWRAWRSEVFADVCGCLGGGPAYAGALFDFLLADPAALLADTPSHGGYPPVSLRVRINICILEASGLASEAQELLTAWESFFPLTSILEPYLQDALEIVRRFVRTPLASLGGKSLVSILSFNSSQYAASKQQAQLALAGKDLKDYDDFRVNLAATRLAYEKDPQALFKPCEAGAPSPLDRLKDSLTGMLTNDLRSGERSRSPEQQSEIDRQNQKAGAEDYSRLVPGADRLT